MQAAAESMYCSLQMMLHTGLSKNFQLSFVSDLSLWFVSQTSQTSCSELAACMRCVALLAVPSV